MITEDNDPNDKIGRPNGYTAAVGAEVAGQFSVDTWDNDVTGSGTVETERLPDVNKIRMVKVGTGERHLFGLLERKKLIESGYEVDRVFESMIEDYYYAYSRFLVLLEHR